MELIWVLWNWKGMAFFEMVMRPMLYDCEFEFCIQSRL